MLIKNKINNNNKNAITNKNENITNIPKQINNKNNNV